MVKHISSVQTVLLVIVITCYLHVARGDNGQIHKYVYNNNGLGVYSFEFETSDGTYRREEGGHNSDKDGLVVRGEFWYTDPRGKRYAVRYIADSNGFQPQIDDDDTRFNDRRIV